MRLDALVAEYIKYIKSGEIDQYIILWLIYFKYRST